MEQTFNYLNYINSIKISPDEYLLPLFEVIINSIQGIEDKKDCTDGHISIKVLRQKENSLIEEMEQPYRPIIGFEVYDNGIGFIEERFRAFSDAYTDYNAKKGCKGVGRYTVLACFGSMDINSTFYENGEWYNRDFQFGYVKSSTPDKTKSDKKEPKTIVRLNNYKSSFSDYIKKGKVELEDIAKEIIQHCSLYFIDNSMPQICLYDDFTTYTPIFLNDMYRTVIQFDKKSEPIKIGKIDFDFNLHYLRNYSNKSHSIHLCANKREVGKKTPIITYIPSFVQSLIDNQQKKYYVSVYVTGQFLDEKANNQRNEFSIPKKNEEKNEWLDLISMEELFVELSNSIKNNYLDDITTADKEKNDRIRNYILDPKTPRLAYKHLLSVENIFEDIPANATNERLEADLAKKVFQLEQKRTKAFNKAFKKKQYDKEEFGKIITEVLREETAFSKDRLSDLLVRRKSVIKLFNQYLKWRSEDNYMLEEDLHNIFFTMGAESDSMPSDYHNLWLLDERLVFYRRTNSAKQLRTNKDFDIDSQKAPDLLIYDFPWAYSDNPNSVNTLVVFEFKRPGRDMNTSVDKDLDEQIKKYFKELMQSKAKNDNGILLNITENTAKFGYVICDLDKDLINHNKQWNGFKLTPHNTLYKINSELNMYIEVMTYQTMIDFAEKRHNAFFQALGIDFL